MRGGQRIAVVEGAVDSSSWADIERRAFRELRRPDADGGHRLTWERPLRPLFEKLAAHLEGVECVVLLPNPSGQQLPWSVVAETIGWRTSDI